MNSLINEAVMSKVFDDKSFRKEMYEYINETLDNEMLKSEEEMDCDLIMWCTDMLIELEKEENDDFSIILPMFNDKMFAQSVKRHTFSSLSKGSRALLAACITMFFAITANAAVAEIFDYNIAHEIVNAIQERIAEFKADGREEEEIIAVIPETTTAPDKEEPTTAVNAVKEETGSEDHDAGIEQETTTTKPEVTGSEDHDAGMEQEPTERVELTGIQGYSPDKLVYTTDDRSLELAGLRVRFVYSNGTYSKWYYENSARIIRGADFDKLGTQEIILNINNTYDYKYKIIVKAPEVEKDDIKSVSLGHIGTVSFKFYLNEEPELDNLYLDVKYMGGKSERVYYRNTDEMLLAGINNSIETYGSSRQFTIYYKGFTVYADYIVVNRRNEVYDARITAYYNDRYSQPKFLYYYGEPLSVGKGINSEEEIPKLVSSDPFEAGGKPYDWNTLEALGFVVSARTVGSTGVIYYNSDELDIYGYDPYKLGFQRLDVYYEGVYLTSYMVFVYGDDGYCPAVSINPFVDYADEGQITIDKWYRCIGGGKLQTQSGYFNELKKTMQMSEIFNEPSYKLLSKSVVLELEDKEKLGWQNAVCRLSDEYTYPLEIAQQYNIITYSVDNGDKEYFEFNMNDMENPDFGNASITFDIRGVGDVTYQLNDIRTVARIVSDGTDTGSKVDSSLEMKSAFVRYQLMLDRDCFTWDKYKTWEYIRPISVDAFIYQDGCENNITLEIIGDKNEEHTYSVNETADSNIRRFNYRLVADDNYIIVDRENITLSGVDFTQVGEYDAVFSTVYNGREIECKRHYTVVKALATTKLEIVYDENKDKLIMPKDAFSFADSTFVYTNKKGEKIELTADMVTYASNGVDDYGNFKCEIGEKFYVDYKYNNVFCRVWYNCWGKLSNVSTNYSKSAQVLYVAIKDTMPADYYVVTCGDEEIVTSSKNVRIDKEYLVSGGGVRITPHIVIDGEDIAGATSYFSYVYFS